jgi:hypothetical protein
MGAGRSGASPTRSWHFFWRSPLYGGLVETVA